MMRRSSVDQSVTLSGVGFGDAESLFCSKPISEIRNVESNTRKQIEDKKEELRQLIGNRYRDLIDSADSILSMKSFCESISSNILNISDSIFSLSSESPEFSLSTPHTDPNRIKIYGIACRVKYLVDTPENIWGCLDESMFLEAAARYVRAKLVNQSLNLVNSLDSEGAGRILAKNFPLLTHQWQIVDSFRAQITQRSRERLLVMEKNDSQNLPIGAFADALAGVAVIDDLDPKQAFDLFLQSRKLWIMQKLNACGSSSADDRGSFDSSAVVSVFVEVTKIIQVTIGQVGELFLQLLSDKPLFYKAILDSPPASQLFGGIPNPDDEVRSWKEFRDRLESVMVILDREFIAQACSAWLRDCGKEIVNEISGRHLIDAIANGEQLASAEKLIREMMDSKDVLKGSLDWLRSIIGSEVELPWNRTRELVLEDNVDLWDEIFEDAFIHRMKVIIDSKFDDLTSVVNVKELVTAIGGSTDDYIDFQAYLNRSSSDGGVWFVDPNAKRASLVPSAKSFFEESDFRSCLHAYFGPEVSRIRDAVDNCCQSLLEDLICFLESPKSTMRLKDLAPYLQKKCYDSMSSILMDLKNELEQLHSGLHSVDKDTSLPPTTMVERSLFIGRLLFAFQNHLKHMPVLLGSPRLWANETQISGSKMLPSLLRLSRFSIDSAAHGSPGKHMLTSPRRQTSLVATALCGADDCASPKLEDLNRTIRDLCIMAHGLWISWVSDELGITLSQDLRGDDGLSTLTPLRGWEVISVKQEQSSERESEIKIALPSIPSLYITSFLFKSCQEINQVGGHVLDKNILQQFALRLLEKVITVYGDFITNHEDLVSEKGALQVLLDLKFATDVLSGGDLNATEGVSKSPVTKYAFRRKQEQKTKSATREHLDKLVKRFTERLDPIDWLTYEPYLWENERQSYLRHAILFGFFVQLNRMYTDSMQRLPTNSESNIMRCSTIPRFKYLPISAPALSSRGVTKTPLRTSSDDMSSRIPWRAHTDGDLSQGIDFNSNNSLGVATPFLKSFMQVGNRILTDAQVGRFKDRSAAAMSTFGDILPFQSQSFLSSLTTARTDS